MNVNPVNGAFTKKLRQFIATLLAGLFIFAGANLATSATISVLDSLGVATPDTEFSVTGSNGTSILPFQFVGPEFTLTQPTTLTEIGAFVNNLRIDRGGRASMPGNTSPYRSNPSIHKRCA